MYKATKEFRFEMAHVLTKHPGRCGNLHGHSYICRVTLSSPTLQEGMVMDFADVKKAINDNILDQMDHACAFNLNSDDEFEIKLHKLCKSYGKRIVEFPFRTTAENMSRYIYEKANDLLRDLFVSVTKVELWETATGHATYEETEN